MRAHMNARSLSLLSRALVLFVIMPPKTVRYMREAFVLFFFSRDGSLIFFFKYTGEEKKSKNKPNKFDRTTKRESERGKRDSNGRRSSRRGCEGHEPIVILEKLEFDARTTTTETETVFPDEKYDSQREK